LTAPAATDWGEVLVTPIWGAVVAAGLALGALWLVGRRPRWLDRLLRASGASSLNVMGVEVELSAAYTLRGLPSPDPDQRYALSALAGRIEPLLRGRGVLWIDAKPSNNRHEVAALRGLGVQVDQVASTAAARARLNEPTMPIDLVIANWTRPHDKVADGIDVLPALCAPGRSAPLVFYVGDASPERKAQAAAAGAVGLTNEPDELFRLALVQLATARP
jgi:CheY-like chemotaxis protein